jgi:alpha-ketoglutarate-dependent 2,4-dichlorophenoxyacetate dioxygenase
VNLADRNAAEGVAAWREWQGGPSLLRDLTGFATQPRFVYSHEWRPYDLVVWDKQQTMHRTRRFDHREVLDVRRTTLAGDVATIAKVG